MRFDEPFGGLIPGARGAVLATLLRTDVPLTGRQVYAVVSDRYSLWSVQQALRAWTQLGLIDTAEFGRSHVHTVNDEHVAVGPMRALLDPFTALTDVIRATLPGGGTAILFGSLARGDARPDSDIDLAVLTAAGWNNRAELETAIARRLGNRSDVLAFTTAQFARLAKRREPVVVDILREGIALVGSMPRIAVPAA